MNGLCFLTKLGVMISFDDATPKRIFRFDRGIEEEASGFFVEPEEKSELEEKYDSLFVESLFEVLREQKGPCILHLKEAENTVLSNIDRISAFKKELSKIDTPLIIIGKYSSRLRFTF